MVFDAVSVIRMRLLDSLSPARSQAQTQIEEQLRQGIIDQAQFYSLQSDLKEMLSHKGNLLEFSRTHNVANLVLKSAADAVEKLEIVFGVHVELPEEEIAKLRKVEALYLVGDLRVDADLMRWADGVE